MINVDPIYATESGTGPQLRWLNRLDLPWESDHQRSETISCSWCSVTTCFISLLLIKWSSVMGLPNIPGTIAFSILWWDSVCDMCFAFFSVLPQTIVVGASVVLPLFQTLPPYRKYQVYSIWNQRVSIDKVLVGFVWIQLNTYTIIYMYTYIHINLRIYVLYL